MYGIITSAGGLDLSAGELDPALRDQLANALKGATLEASVTGSAKKLEQPFALTITGDLTGSAEIDGSKDVVIAVKSMSVPTYGWVTLKADQWISDGKAYRQPVQLKEMTKHCRVDFDLSIGAAAAIVSPIQPVNDNGAFYALAVEKPETDITVQYTMTQMRLADLLPPMVRDLTANADNQTVTLLWTAPLLDDRYAGMVVVYKTEGYPTSPTDGTAVDVGLDQSLTLTGLANDVPIYFRCYPYNQYEEYQTSEDGAVITATPSLGPLQVTDFAVSGSDTAPVLTWVNPVDDRYVETVIIQKEGGVPANLTDGTEIYRGTDTTITASCPDSGVDYYFAAFTLNENGGHRSPVVTEYMIENPAAVSGLAVSGAGAQPVISWTNPTDEWYRETVVIQKDGSAPVSLTDGEEVYRGSGDTFTANGLELDTDYYWAVFALNAAGGHGEMVTVGPYRFAMPAEPTSYSEVVRITSGQTYTFPEVGYFRVIAVAGGGNGGYSDRYYDSDEESWEYMASGGSGGSGGICASNVTKTQLDSITVSFSGKSVSIPELGMSAIGGGNGANGDGTGPNRAAGGSAGSASGGNLTNTRGTAGKIGDYEVVVFGRSVSGGARVSTSWSGYTSYGGEGQGLEIRTASSSGMNFSTTGSRTGSSPFVVILRGNTNIPAATD